MQMLFSFRGHSARLIGMGGFSYRGRNGLITYVVTYFALCFTMNKSYHKYSIGITNDAGLSSPYLSISYAEAPYLIRRFHRVLKIYRMSIQYNGLQSVYTIVCHFKRNHCFHFML
jgi:hypothetical protein